MTEETNAPMISMPSAGSGQAPFVSYAQNFEDVMLRRALAHVTEGRYVDIGAGEPEADSVTLAFYKANWRGVNVEPLSGPFERLVEARPRDTNLGVAVGASVGEAVLYVVGPESGLSTLNPDFAVRYAAEGWPISERRVPMTTLAGLCAGHVTGEIHFLKIDAEGSELDILSGADFTRWRPWIILVEATMPNSQASSHDAWETILTGNGYQFCYFDGLNRFYVSDEQMPSLRSAFAVPPNIADDFVLARMMRLPENGLDAERTHLLHAAEERAAEAQARAHAAQAALDDEHAQVATLHARADHAEDLAHAAQARASELEGQARSAASQLSEAASALLVLRNTADMLEAQLAASRREMEQARLERDTWAQELFESNRYCAELVRERQMLLVRCSASANDLAKLNENEHRWSDESTAFHAQITGLQHAAVVLHQQMRSLQVEAAQRTQEITYFRSWFEAMRGSTSWSLTRPLRMMGRLIGR